MDFVDNRIDPSTGTMRGRAVLDNSNGLLVPGLFVRLRLIGETKPGAVLVPDGAIGTDQTPQRNRSRSASDGLRYETRALQSLQR